MKKTAARATDAFRPLAQKKPAHAAAATPPEAGEKGIHLRLGDEEEAEPGFKAY